jgi:serine/threonine protein kinase
MFNNDKLNCICENIYKQHLDTECKCNQMKTYSSQGKSGAAIHSIICKTQFTPKHKIDKIGQKQVLKVVPLSHYYIKLRTETEKYMFIECDGFTIQTLINTYVYKELPHNTVNIFHSGVCNKTQYKNVSIKGKTHGYNLMEEADLGSGRDFLNNIVNGNYDKEFKITNEDTRYVMVCNCLLQIVLIIGHLQSCSLEFFHGDYKPENIFVKSCPLDKTKTFKFNVFGKSIKVKNMGFAILIADFDKSSMSLHSNLKNNKKYRIISPILFKPLLTSYVNNIIKTYGDIDPDIFQGEIKIDKLFISNLIPKKIDPTITVLRSAGVKLYRDIDLYTFFIRLIETEQLRTYIIKHKLNTTIMNFMSDRFRNVLFGMPVRNISLNESAFIVVSILKKIKEPLPVIFKPVYLNMLRNLNYKLFKM